MSELHRRKFLRRSLVAAALPALGMTDECVLAEELRSTSANASSKTASDLLDKMKFGLVTYLWGQHFDLPAILKACESSGLLGVEVRAGHRHGIDPTLSKLERLEVRKRFADSPVSLVGYGSSVQFHEDDPRLLKQNIESAKQCIQLMYDCGGTGVKVRPNGFVPGVLHEQTIEQIGKSLNEVASYGAVYGQEIRVEVHSPGTSELPVMKQIFDIATHPNAKICWNSNGTDLNGRGLEYNFNLVKDRLGATVHVRELDKGDYPYADLFKLFLNINYDGWILLEAHSECKKCANAMSLQLDHFKRLTHR